MGFKSITGTACACLAVASINANAALFGRLPVTLGGTDYQAYYDDQLNITILQYANSSPMTWQSANSWAVNFNIESITGWRLPAISEYEQLYASGITLSSPGPFSIPAMDMWSGTSSLQNPSYTWAFGFLFGFPFELYMGGGPGDTLGAGWAVHDGDIAPNTVDKIISDEIAKIRKEFPHEMDEILIAELAASRISEKRRTNSLDLNYRDAEYKAFMYYGGRAQNHYWETGDDTHVNLFSNGLYTPIGSAAYIGLKWVAQTVFEDTSFLRADPDSPNSPAGGFIQSIKGWALGRQAVPIDEAFDAGNVPQETQGTLLQPITPSFQGPLADISPNNKFIVNANAATRLYYDPEFDVKYDYVEGAGNMVTTITVPLGLGYDAASFQVYVGGNSYVFSAGEIFDFRDIGFVNGVSSFALEGSGLIGISDYVLGITFLNSGITMLVQEKVDFDSDGIENNLDNCYNVSNTNQRDTDSDGYGNICDADLDQSSLVNSLDIGLLKNAIFTNDANADFNGDGIVNSLDIGLFKQMFFQLPGPSGLVE